MTDLLERPPVQPQPEEPESKSKPKHTRRNAIIASVAGVAVAAGAFGIGTALNSSAEAPAKGPAAAGEPLAPDQSIDNEETDPTTPEVSYEIPSGLDAETLSKLVVEDILTEWDNAGTDASLVDRAIKENKGWDGLLPIVAQEQAEAFTDDLFVPGWEDTSVADFVEKQTAVNLNVLKQYTANKSYITQETVTNVLETNVSPTERFISIDISETDTVAGTPEHSTGTYLITFVTSGETEKISSIEFHVK